MNEAEAREIPLTQGQLAIVDADMFDYLNQFKWWAHKDGNTFYAETTVPGNGKRLKIKMHHVVSGKPLYKLQTDHRNGNGLDNRRDNLRTVSNRENGRNRIEIREGRKSSKFIGVYWNKTKLKWQAYMKIGTRSIYLGRFEKEKEAYERVKQASAGII